MGPRKGRQPRWRGHKKQRSKASKWTQMCLDKQRAFSTKFVKSKDMLSTLRGFVQHGVTTVVAGLEGSADSSWAPFLDALRADVDDAYPDRVIDSPSGGASCCPSIVRETGAGELHTAIAKGDLPRGRIGDYRDAAALVVCMEGEACLTIYHREEVVATIPVTAGGWVTFPGRLFHRVDGGTRLVFTCLLVGAPRAH
jgi:hypothetical protein